MKSKLHYHLQRNRSSSLLFHCRRTLRTCLEILHHLEALEHGLIQFLTGRELGFGGASVHLDLRQWLGEANKLIMQLKQKPKWAELSSAGVA